VVKKEFKGFIETARSNLKTSANIIVFVDQGNDDMLVILIGVGTAATAANADTPKDAGLDWIVKYYVPLGSFPLFYFHILNTSTKHYKVHHFDDKHSISFGNENSCSGNLWCACYYG